MPARDFVPALNFFAALNAAPLRPLHTLMRTTEERFRPARVVPHRPDPGSAAGAVADGPGANRAAVLHERGSGRLPTIVLGGLVPDSSEQVFLLRRFLRHSGDVYYFHYPRDGFSLDTLCAQLSALVGELCAAGQPPVVFAVSFGAGIVLDWLRRTRVAGGTVSIAGLVFISPVTCVADLIAPGASKPGTLLGRALKPYLDAGDAPSDAVIEKSRVLFLRMFESGAKNKETLRLLMTQDESTRLRNAVLATIHAVTFAGARKRVEALAQMVPPTEYFSPRVLPLTNAPTLVLFAEDEDVVLDASAPVRLAFERASRAYFPQSVARVIAAKAGEAPVQHASLVFHVFEFLPSLQAFYQRLRRAPLPAAA